MSIKIKIALFNTILVSIVVLLLFSFMVFISNSVVDSSSKNQLKYILEENAEEIEWEDDVLELDDIDFYKNHVTTLVYSKDGYLISGNITHREIFDTYPLSQGEISNTTIEGVDYLIYDTLVESRKNDDVFLRGIISVTEMTATVDLLFHLTLITLPFFIILAGFGSYFISKKSMKPLEKIIDTAKDISSGDDLSQRINLGNGKDEIHKLGETFDIMFSQLEEAFIVEKQFSSDVSHELRTPTAVILAECDCNLNEMSTAEDKTEALEIIQRQAKKMQQLISALLNFIRLDNGVCKLEKEEVDFSELILIVCEEQESLLDENKTLHTDIAENIYCNVDYMLIIRVISNLIDNGFHYGKDNGYVKVCLQDGAEEIILTVEDDGIGIAEENIDRIFNRFFQVDPSRDKEIGKNMGLGLSMVAQIVKLHSGSIEVVSVLGEGSSFKITLPKNKK